MSERKRTPACKVMEEVNKWLKDNLFAKNGSNHDNSRSETIKDSQTASDEQSTHADSGTEDDDDYAADTERYTGYTSVNTSNDSDDWATVDPDLAGQPFTRTLGIPLAPDSLDAATNVEPSMTAPSGVKILLAGLDQPIMWEGLFVLPNYESRLNLFLHQSRDYVHAMRKPPYHYILPISEKITHIV